MVFLFLVDSEDIFWPSSYAIILGHAISFPSQVLVEKSVNGLVTALDFFLRVCWSVCQRAWSLVMGATLGRWRSEATLNLALILQRLLLKGLALVRRYHKTKYQFHVHMLYYKEVIKQINRNRYSIHREYFFIPVLNLHREFLDAGSDVIQAYTFYANDDSLSLGGGKEIPVSVTFNCILTVSLQEGEKKLQ